MEKIRRFSRNLLWPTWPKYLAYLLIVAAGVWIALIWTGKAPFRFYCGTGVTQPPLGTIYPTLIGVLATIFALLISLMLVTVQLSANTYTPRVIKLHFNAIHFKGIVFSFLVTIVYLIWRFAQAQHWDVQRCNFAETGFVLFFTSLLLLIPYTWISLRILRPKFLLERLLWDITADDFRRAAEGRPNKLDEKLQPVIDIIRRTAKDGQLRTVEDAFEGMEKRFGEMIRRSKEEPLSNQIAVSLRDGLFEIGRFANTLQCFEVSMRVLKLLKRFIENYIVGATQRTSAVVLFGTFKKLRDDFVLRYDKKKWPVEHDAVTILFAECQALIAEILSK